MFHSVASAHSVDLASLGISLQGFAYSSGASALEMTTSSWSARQSSISPMSPSSPSMRRGGGVLLSEPSAGNDTVYDGAHQMQSTEYLFGARGGRWSTGQAAFDMRGSAACRCSRTTARFSDTGDSPGTSPTNGMPIKHCASPRDANTRHQVCS